MFRRLVGVLALASVCWPALAWTADGADRSRCAMLGHACESQLSAPCCCCRGDETAPATPPAAPYPVSAPQGDAAASVAAGTVVAAPPLLAGGSFVSLCRARGFCPDDLPTRYSTLLI